MLKWNVFLQVGNWWFFHIHDKWFLFLEPNEAEFNQINASESGFNDPFLQGTAVC